MYSKEPEVDRLHYDTLNVPRMQEIVSQISRINLRSGLAVGPGGAGRGRGGSVGLSRLVGFQSSKHYATLLAPPQYSKPCTPPPIFLRL